MGKEHMQDFRTVAVAAAQQAGKIIADACGATYRVDYKQGAITNMVTDVDRRAEQAIVDILTAAFPDHRILAEEGGKGHGEDSPYRWIVDPLDGTTNFTHGFPAFCVSIGLEVEGRIVLGVVYDPLRRELFEAEAGKGSCLNGQRIHVSSVPTLNKALLVTGFAYDRKNRQRNLEHFERFVLASQGLLRTGKPSKSRLRPPGSHPASPACRRRHRRHPLMRPWSYERLAEGVVLFLLAHGRGGAVAGKENESLGQCQDAFPDALQVNRVERGGVSPPDGAGEERVADEHVRVRLVAHPTRRMAGGGHQADFFPAHLKRVPLARERAQAWRRLPAQQGPVPFPDVHERWVARQDRVDAARVVGMAVRQADGGERQPVLLDRAEDGLGDVAGVDKDSMTGGP